MDKALLNKIGIIVLSIIVVGFLFKNTIIKIGIEIGAGQVLGFKTKVGSVKFSPFSGAITIKDIKIKNPKGYTEELFSHVSLVELNLNVGALLSGKTHIDKLSLHLDQFTIERLAKESNISRLKMMQKKKDKEKKVEAAPKDKSKLKFHIETLSLSIQELNYVSNGKKRTLDLNFNETLTNISSPAQLVSVVIVKVIKEATIGRLPLGKDLLNIRKDLARNALKGINEAADKLKAELDKATKALQNNEAVQVLDGLSGDVSEKAKEVTGKLGGLLDQGTGSLKDLLGASEN